MANDTISLKGLRRGRIELKEIKNFVDTHPELQANEEDIPIVSRELSYTKKKKEEAEAKGEEWDYKKDEFYINTYLPSYERELLKREMMDFVQEVDIALIKPFSIDREDIVYDSKGNIIQSSTHHYEHPFDVEDNEEMENLKRMIAEDGQMEAAIIRQEDDGTYLMLSGHRRMRALQLLGEKKIKCLVMPKDKCSDEKAIKIMAYGNSRRERIKPSEKAKIYRLRMDETKRKNGYGQGARNDLNEDNKSPKSSGDEIGAIFKDSKMNVSRYVRLSYLIPEILKGMIDTNKMAIKQGVELSYLSEASQKVVYDVLSDVNKGLLLKQAKSIRMTYNDVKSKNRELTKDDVENIIHDLKNVRSGEDKIIMTDYDYGSLIPDDILDDGPDAMKEYVVKSLKIRDNLSWRLPASFNGDPEDFFCKAVDFYINSLNVSTEG